MSREQLSYEPPKTKIYRFDDNDRILTESGNPVAEYAAAALNELFGEPDGNGINTTIE